MYSLKQYRSFLAESEIQDKSVQDALSWLKNKYGEDLYTFKNIPGMDMNGSVTKSYDITVGEETYKLHLRKFDTNNDGDMDTVGFDVISTSPEEKKEEIGL